MQKQHNAVLVVLLWLGASCALGQTVDTTFTFETGPWVLSYDPAVKQVYCVHMAKDEPALVTVIDATTNHALRHFEIPSGPYAVCLNPAQHVLYCAHNASDQLSVIDPAHDSVITTALEPIALRNSKRDEVSRNRRNSE
jgi:DNA-binding beta-propeller fold protein YncE